MSALEAGCSAVAAQLQVDAAVALGAYQLDDELVEVYGHARADGPPFPQPLDHTLPLVRRGLHGTTAATHEAGTELVATEPAYTGSATAPATGGLLHATYTPAELVAAGAGVGYAVVGTVPAGALLTEIVLLTEGSEDVTIIESSDPLVLWLALDDGLQVMDSVPFGGASGLHDSGAGPTLSIPDSRQTASAPSADSGDRPFVPVYVGAARQLRLMLDDANLPALDTSGDWVLHVLATVVG